MSEYLTSIVESGPEEPSEKELEKRQKDILKRLQSVTADQLKEFRGRSLDAQRAAEIKVSWQKTVWAK